MNTKHAHGARVGALALAVALALPTTALAQTDKEKELEARIAQLEQLVQTLVSQQQQTNQQVSEEVTKQVAAATAAAPAGPDAIQSKRITIGANPNTEFSFGGFIKLDAMYTKTTDGDIPENSAGRLFFVPGTIPVGGASEKADLDVHSQFSRFWLGTNTTLDSGDKIRSYFEMDLFGGALGNEVSTNTYGVTIRHAFVSWNNWLAGQTWSNFQDTGSLPDTVDFLGVSAGTVFVRQSQLRYTNGPWSLSLENPRTIATPFGSSGRFTSNDGQLPDMTVRYLHKADWGHFSVAGLVRQLAVEDTGLGVDDRTIGGGVSVSGKYNIGANNDLRFMANYGDGISRYIGFAINNDTNISANGNLKSIGMFSGYAAFHHVFSPKLRGNLYGAMATFDNDNSLATLAVTENVYSAHANLIWTVLPKLDVGAEAMWATRELESGASGDLKRLQFHVKYSF